MDKRLLALLARFAERGNVVSDGSDGKPPRLRSTFSGVRALKSSLSRSRMKELALAAGVPAPGSGQPGEWQDSDSERVLAIAFTDEGIDRHGTIFPADGWSFDSFLRNPAVLLNHSGEFPIGIGLMIERKTISGADGKRRPGYVLHALFSREDLNPQAEIAFRNVVAGRLRGASHSFDLRNVRYADEKDAKKYGVGIDTPMLEAELLEVSVVTIGSNPNVGPGRALVQAEARALAASRTSEDKPIFDQTALRLLYGADVVTDVEAAAAGEAAHGASWDDLTRASAQVETALEAVAEYRALSLDVSDADEPREFVAGQPPADDLEALRALLQSLTTPAPSARTVVVNGESYVHEGSADAARRRRLLIGLATRALEAAGQENPPEPHVLIRLDGEEDLRTIVTEVRTAMAEVRSMLAALDPLGSSGGGLMADATLDTPGLIQRMKALEKKTTALLS